MDKTVTTPLDVGAGGQQRFVVAYTLKQGAEKQPDILSAQKDSTSSTISLKDSLLSSPAAIRPDGLLLNSSRNNYVSEPTDFPDGSLTGLSFADVSWSAGKGFWRATTAAAAFAEQHATATTAGPQQYR